jgi:hypothetical protein
MSTMIAGRGDSQRTQEESKIFCMALPFREMGTISSTAKIVPFFGRGKQTLLAITLD